jgi:hypothetical protein
MRSLAVLLAMAQWDSELVVRIFVRPGEPRRFLRQNPLQPLPYDGIRCRVVHMTRRRVWSLRFPFPGMHYVLVAGGNAFYEKR